MAKRDEDDSTGYTGKRKKTWRELDAQRGKSKHASRQDDPAQERLAQSASYERYKKGAEALFTGGAVPEGLEAKFDPDGKKRAQKEDMMKLREMDRKAWVQGVLDYLEKYPELPEDAFFLDALLDHPRERIVDKALAKLESLFDAQAISKEKTPKSLEQRLKSLELTSTDPEVQQRAKVLRDRIRA